MVWLLGSSALTGQAQEALLGMKIEKVAQEDAGITVVSTGAEFSLEKNGTVRCFQRIPTRREIARVALPQEVLPLSVSERNDFTCVVSGQGIRLTLQGDSLMILQANKDFNLAFQGLFQPAYQAEKEGKWLFIDDTGGFGIYPVEKKETRAPDFRQSPWGIAYRAAKGEQTWISVFPPRPYNWQRAYGDLAAHEGNQEPHRFPSDSLIRSSAKYCKVMVVHSWFWPGGDQAPWKIPRFVLKNAQDLEKFNHMRDELHRHGMKLLPYFSPFYYSGQDFFGEVRRALDEYQVDGLYFDGVSMDFRKSYQMVRKTRQMLGNDRLLFSHCSTDPLGSNRIYCPFIDTYSDYIYRGEAGKGGLERDAFLRWTVSGYKISNAVGYWVFTGADKGPYVRKTPTTADMDAAIRSEVRIPRTEIGYEQGLAWEPNDGHLQLFDRYYYGKLASRYEELKHTGEAR